MDVHPKYIKFEKVGLFRRAINAARAFIESIHNAGGFLLNAPLNALEAFAEREIEVIDRQLMLKDAQGEEQYENGEDGVLRLQIQEEEEPWQKKHREMYEKEEDDE